MERVGGKGDSWSAFQYVTLVHSVSPYEPPLPTLRLGSAAEVELRVQEFPSILQRQNKPTK